MMGEQNSNLDSGGKNEKHRIVSSKGNADEAQSTSRRLLIKAGWTVPVIMAASRFSNNAAFAKSATKPKEPKVPIDPKK